MTNDKKTLTGIFVLVFPLLVLGGLWAKAATYQNVGQQIWKLKITGYDPRDILYGHYLRYRIDWDIKGEQGAMSLPAEDLCMCLNSSGNGFKAPAAYPVHCEAPANNSCSSVIKVYNHYNRYTLQQSSEPEKYFIPEENATEIDRLFRAGEVPFYMEVMAHDDHSVAIRGLYVDNVRLEDYLRNMPAKKSVQP
jgi:uncharacterized membrane-anchored protein